MKKKVCILVHTHSFLDSRIFKKEAISLQKNGYDVTMIVPRVKGKLFDIDKKPFDTQFLEESFIHEGIKIITYNLQDFRPPVDLMQSHIDEMDYTQFDNPLTNIGLSVDADVYHAHEMGSLYAGIGIKRTLQRTKQKHVKLIFDSHDLIPDPLDNKTISKENKVKMLRLLNRMIHEIDYMITVSESIKSWFLAKKPLLPIEIVYNSPPLATDYTEKKYDHNKLTVCYEGHIADTRKGSKVKIFKMTKLCSNKIDFNFKIIGGVLHGHSLTIPSNLKDRIQLTGWVDYHSIAQHMKDVDVGWIDFDELQYSLNRAYALPNKFFSYLNNGVPVVVNKCHEMENFIRVHRCGLVVNKPKATAKDYAEAFLYLNENKDKLREMSKNARRIMEEVYSWENMEKRLLLVYDSLINNYSHPFSL
ncbi:glycosyltransferase [Metabacillus fastidiosus]|uniref:glycosyltransferase n=1 Tax=Metabacillus fastidiosus TaxID=1458 RepID=UPI002E1D27A8|nr:glycosyltransferase [Metabacillus fastidiosus]